MGPVNHYDILGRCFKPADDQMKHDTTTAAAGLAARTATRTANNRVDYSLLRASRKLQQQQQMQVASEGGAAAAGMLRKVQQLRHAVSCADRRYASVYYNSPEVRQALHAASEDATGRWGPKACLHASSSLYVYLLALRLQTSPPSLWLHQARYMQYNGRVQPATPCYHL